MKFLTDFFIIFIILTYYGPCVNQKRIFYVSILSKSLNIYLIHQIIDHKNTQ